MELRRWSFLNELIPLVIILLVIDYGFDKSLLAWEPSPLWLLILLIAPRRGSVAGLVCGLVAVVIYFWALSEQGYLWQDMLHRKPAILVRAGLFVFFGCFLGAISENQTSRIAHFRKKSEALAAQLESSEIKRMELERASLNMEKRIAGWTSTVLTLHEAFKRLRQAPAAEDLFTALDLVLREDSGAATCGIWRIGLGAEELVGGNFKGAVPAIALSAGANHKIIDAAAWSRESDAAPGADLAALVLDKGDARLVVALEGIPFARLDRELILRVELLAEQAGDVLKALRTQESMRRQAAMDSESGLVSEIYLRRRVEEEAALASRHKTRLSLLACAIDASESIQPRLVTALSCAMRASVRFSDGLAWFANAGAFVCVLPECDEQGARRVLDKIKANLASLNLRDGHGRPVYELAWRVYTYDGALQGDAIFARLLAGLGPGEQ